MGAFDHAVLGQVELVVGDVVEVLHAFCLKTQVGLVEQTVRTVVTLTDVTAEEAVALLVALDQDDGRGALLTQQPYTIDGPAYDEVLAVICRPVLEADGVGNGIDKEYRCVNLTEHPEGLGLHEAVAGEAEVDDIAASLPGDDVRDGKAGTRRRSSLDDGCAVDNDRLLCFGADEGERRLAVGAYPKVGDLIVVGQVESILSVAPTCGEVVVAEGNGVVARLLELPVHVAAYPVEPALRVGGVEVHAGIVQVAHVVSATFGCEQVSDLDVAGVGPESHGEAAALQGKARRRSGTR